MNDTSYIYFMSNKYNNVLYVGVTNDLVRRVAEHKAKINKGFTCKYNTDKLVYFEQYQLMTDAIAREKQLKNWKREWKDALIIKENPEWKDLSESIGVDEEYVDAVKSHYQGIADRVRNDGAPFHHCRIDPQSLENKGDSDFRQNDGRAKEIADEIPCCSTIRNDGTKCSIFPEQLPPAEDIKKVERKLKSDEKKALNNKNKQP